MKEKKQSKSKRDEQNVTLKFVPFPASLPGDPELVWALAKCENMTNDEAGMALSKINPSAHSSGELP